jgi:hypothetical protein
MKKTLLLGTTALMAAGLVASGAAQAAEEPIVAGIGGYMVQSIGVVSQNNDAGELADPKTVSLALTPFRLASAVRRRWITASLPASPATSNPPAPRKGLLTIASPTSRAASA